MSVKGPSSPLRRPLPVPSSDEEGADLRGPGDGTQGSLENAALYSSGPGSVSVDAGEPGLSLDLAGRSLSGGATLHDAPEGGASVSTALGVSSGGAWAELRRADGDRADGVDVSWSPGWLSGGGSHAWATAGGGATEVSSTLAWYGSGMGLGASLASTSEGGFKKALSAMGFLDADRGVKDLGPVEGQPDQRRLEVRRSLGASGLLSPKVGGALLGIGGRISAGKDRSVVYRTAVSDDEARALVHEKKGVTGWLRDKARALGLKEDPVSIPNLAQPEGLLVGDELVTTVSGSFGLGLFLGGLPVRLGAYGHMRGDFELAAKRLDDRHVELVVTPLTIRGVQARAGAPWLLEADVGRQAGQALRQGFIFDLEEPEGREAYLRALQGELPGGVPAKAKGKRREADELVKALSDERLPAGTARTFVDAVALKRGHKGLSATFGLWNRGSDFGGLGVQKVSLQESRAHLSRAGVFHDDTRAVERRRQVLLSGEEARGVYAKKRRVTVFDDEGSRETRFESLELKLTFSDTCLRGSQLDEQVVDVLNEALGLELPAFGRKGRKQTREVAVTRTLEAAELERLAGADEPELADLAARLRGAAGDDARAELVQRFVADRGLEGFALVVRALGEVPDALAVSTSSSAWQEPLEELQALSLRYPEPLAADASKRELSRRFAATEKALVQVSEGLADVDADPLLSVDEKQAARDQLSRAQGDLQALLAVDHLAPGERRELAARLERGWTTSKQRSAIDRLLA